MYDTTHSQGLQRNDERHDRTIAILVVLRGGQRMGESGDLRSEHFGLLRGASSLFALSFHARCPSTSSLYHR